MIFEGLEPSDDFSPAILGFNGGAWRYVPEDRNRLIELVTIVPIQAGGDNGAPVLGRQLTLGSRLARNSRRDGLFQGFGRDERLAYQLTEAFFDHRPSPF